MKLRLVQKHIAELDLVPWVEAADRAGMDLVCFGELAATGCLYEPRPVEPVDRILQRLVPFGVGVMFGAVRVEVEGRYNSYFFRRHRQTWVYDKINLFPPFGEDRIYRPGKVPGLFVTPFGDFGVAVCYDLRFDDIFARLAELAVPYLIVPAAFPQVRIEDWRRLLAQRARELGATVIGVNAVGSDGVNRFGGSSMVVAPDGSIVAQADETGEQILDVTL